MIGLKGKLIAGAAIAVLAFGAGWKVNGWKHDAALKDALEAQADQYREDLAEAQQAAELEEREAAKLSGRLEDIRRERDLALDELDARPTLTRTVTKVLRDDCPVCNCPALGADFRRLWNDPLGAADRRDPGASSPD